MQSCGQQYCHMAWGDCLYKMFHFRIRFFDCRLYLRLVPQRRSCHHVLNSYYLQKHSKLHHIRDPLFEVLRACVRDSNTTLCDFIILIKMYISHNQSFLAYLRSLKLFASRCLSCRLPVCLKTFHIFINWASSIQT